MSVSRKDFEAIAAALASKRPADLEATTTRPVLTDLENLWAETVVIVSTVLGTLNPRFSSERFHTACFGERRSDPWWWKHLTGPRLAEGSRLGVNIWEDPTAAAIAEIKAVGESGRSLYVGEESDAAV